MTEDIFARAMAQAARKKSDEILQKTTLGRVVIFGDSISSGYGANSKWSDYLSDAAEVKNYAVAGSTWGNYAVDESVTDLCCIEQIKNHNSDIENADIVILGYGGNDIKAVLSGNTTYSGVLSSMEECLNYIQTLNINCRIIFFCYDVLYTAHRPPRISRIKELRAELLFEAMIALAYNRNIQTISATNATGILKDAFGYFVQPDNTHPTDLAIQFIGKTMNEKLKCFDTLRPSRKLVVYAGSASSLNPLKIDYEIMYTLAFEFGIDVELLYEYQTGTYVAGHFGYVNSIGKYVQWLCDVNAGDNTNIRFVINLTDKTMSIKTLSNA